jgi:hypothetical protein
LGSGGGGGFGAGTGAGAGAGFSGSVAQPAAIASAKSSIQSFLLIRFPRISWLSGTKHQAQKRFADQESA